ncbi:unnamed protein product, partial [Rotaria sordida]
MMYDRSPVLPFDHQDTNVTLSYDSEHVKKLQQFLSKLNEQAKLNVIKNQQRYKQRYDINRSNPSYNIGDLVLMKTLNIRYKFDIRYEGPFRIIQTITPKTFIVQHVKKPTLYRQVTTDVYQLFTSNQIYLSRNINVQTKFKNYWSDTYPHQSTSSSNGTSTCKCMTCFGILHDNLLALQDAVAFELHRWIDKRLTRQPFDIGLDPSLQHLNDKQMEYRQSLCNYAANDCDAIYQLIINTNIINEQDPDNTTSSITPTNYELEITTDDNDQINNQESPLPSINTSTNEPEHKQLSQEEKKKIHNRSCTIKQRRRYYQHEIIIKNIDKRFKIREIKDILRHKNISFFAVNISTSSTANKRKLYIGIRDPSKLSSYKIQTEDYCPSLKSFIISTCGTQQDTSEITSIITTTKTTNIQHVSIDLLTFNDLIKLLPALQNVKSFYTDNLLFNDDMSNEQHQSMIIIMPLLPRCIRLHVKLSDDITFEHVEYLLKQTPNLKKLFIWGWYPLLHAKKWESLLSIYCTKLINFQLICTGYIFYDNFGHAIDDFQQICQVTSFWFERNATISYDEDCLSHGYCTDINVQFNIKNK